MKTEEEIYASLVGLIRSKGYSSVTELAEHMDKRPNTFGNGLRYFSRTLNYSSKFAYELMQILKIDEKGLREIINDSDKDYPRPTPVNILNLFDNLNKGDVATILSSYAIDFNDYTVREVISKAITRGVRFIHVCNEHHDPIQTRVSDLNNEEEMKEFALQNKFMKQAKINTREYALHFYSIEIGELFGGRIEFENKYGKNTVEEFFDFFMPIVFVNDAFVDRFHSYVIINMDSGKVYENDFSNDLKLWINLSNKYGEQIIYSICSGLRNIKSWQNKNPSGNFLKILKKLNLIDLIKLSEEYHKQVFYTEKYK